MPAVVSQTAEYALRAITSLAGDPGVARTAQQIADATHVPAGYLRKVMQSLVRAGLLTARRGVHGGFNLTRPAEEITVLEVINAIDPIARITECPLGSHVHGETLCPLHRRLDDATVEVERVFAATTIAQILTHPHDECRPMDPGPGKESEGPQNPSAKNE